MMDSSEKVQELRIFSTRVNKSKTTGDGLYKDGFKRALDILLFFLCLPIVLPVLLLLIVLIKVGSRGPAIFKNERIGRNGKKFNCLKLRTMCVNAEEELKKLLQENEILRREWEEDQKLKNDPRITRLGNIIRAFSLDEIPQIFNVLKGEMSFVGPRPIVEEEIAKYENRYKYYKKVRPGITGLWQINGRNDTSYKDRVVLDSKYSEIVNFALDIKILAKTIPVVLSQKGAY